jgi:hypothetical protein
MKKKKLIKQLEKMRDDIENRTTTELIEDVHPHNGDTFTYTEKIFPSYNEEMVYTALRRVIHYIEQQE